MAFSVSVRVKVGKNDKDGTLVPKRELLLLAAYGREELLPIRTPGARKDQPNLPGYFWMTKFKELVWYESRLEMAALKQLDFSLGITAVLPQPFVLHFQRGGRQVRHVPDYLAWYGDGPRHVINVKPRKYVATERNASAFAACDAACQSLGWTYSTFVEPERAFFVNLNWLAGYRRRPPMFERYAQRIVEGVGPHSTIGDVLANLAPQAFARPVLFHLLWNRIIECDLTQVLDLTTELRLAP